MTTTESKPMHLSCVHCGRSDSIEPLAVYGLDKVKFRCDACWQITVVERIER